MKNATRPAIFKWRQTAPELILCAVQVVASVANSRHSFTLYAALQMQPELRDYGQRRDAQGAHPLEARVGINTDEVVVRSVALRAFVLAHG